MFSSKTLVLSVILFSSCLAEKEVRVYGANWCGWTQKLVDAFGGQELIDPIYVECTENEELCSSEGIEGFPTIKIAGEKVDIQRTLEGFATAVDCNAPKVNLSAQPSEEPATC